MKQILVIIINKSQDSVYKRLRCDRIFDSYSEIRVTGILSPTLFFINLCISLTISKTVCLFSMLSLNDPKYINMDEDEFVVGHSLINSGG